ncbi:hypothetical protein [Methylococcus sp. EFPC2]|uniref:hypothetical protein n=1 Tax=Methylococcus sp. EFPC2 TaxID=2812648 RepID=UPI0019674E0B|nr:hypothetical protein [Methylococcus sp. EFPC2]QSA96478.1 hypothetical protein JWZ97_14815 [Methylococcus sp. EFPC2]
MKVLPRDFVETREGLIFAVVDSHVEDNKVLAFLRYAPEGQGPRKVSTDEANGLLAKHYPRYLHHSTRLDAPLHGVPLGDIVHHHRPRERLRIITARGAEDIIEERLLYLVDLLAIKGVPVGDLGVTGSLLIGRQNPASDIDLVAYGSAVFFSARSAVRRLMDDGELDDLSESDWREAYARRQCELDYDEFVWHERRKGNKGMAGGSKFDLALIEACPGMADTLRWRKSGSTVLRARIFDDAGAYGQPSVYRIDHPEIAEILSFTHTYTGQAMSGEWVEAAGSLECCEDGRKRLVIGSSREAPGEYLRVWRGPE